MSQALGPAQRDPLNPSGVQSDLPVVNEGEAGFTGLSPRDSLRYESMTPQEVVRDNLGRSLFGPIPNYVKDGDDVFDDGMKSMLSPGIPQNIREMDANTLTYWSGKLSKSIGMYHDAMNNINGQDQTGTVDDALMTLRTRYQELMAPLEAKRAQILAEMFGPENAQTIVSLKELNPVQASLALGAASASLMRGEDPTNAINMLAAPVREVLARKAKEQEMMKARLGVKYEETGEEMKFERQRYAAEEQATWQMERQDAKDKAAATKQAAFALDQIGRLDPLRYDMEWALTSWENSHGVNADPRTWELAKQMSAKHNREVQSKQAHRDAQTRLRTENADWLHETFATRKQALSAQLQGSKLSNTLKELQGKELSKNLEYLDRTLSLKVMGMRADLKMKAQALELAKKGDQRAWAYLGIARDKMTHDQAVDAWDKSQDEFGNFLRYLNAVNSLTTQIAEIKENTEGGDTSAIEKALKSLLDNPVGNPMEQPGDYSGRMRGSPDPNP